VDEIDERYRRIHAVVVKLLHPSLLNFYVTFDHLYILECYKDTQMKDYDITKFVAEVKSDNVQYGHE